VSTFIATGLVALTLVALTQPISAAEEQPKWFLLRENQIATCWTALLIKIDGAYRHDFAQTAGGPYDTEELALERRKALEQTGTCLQ
jgi:hypothetical protein